MEKFTVLDGVAAALPLINVDTDTIIPARYLKTISRGGLGAAAFSTLRYDAQGAERADFVLNQPRYRGAQILITGANFGCGSSREHAPWSLADLGIRCIIAPSFADIFRNNCFNNGILCVALPQAEVDALAALAGSGNTAGGRFTVDLEAQTIVAPDGSHVAFAIEPGRRADLLAGRDEIARTLSRDVEIAAFETQMPDRPVIECN
jgi:3-isopropylmalate/(R)-2-methylmalate dehydratase small subunit